MRIRVVTSGINPGDINKQQNAFGHGMPYTRVVPHGDGAGIIDRMGNGVFGSQVGERVWCYGTQRRRPFGTAAEYGVVPSRQAVTLPDGIPFEQGACLGIPGITAHRCVHVAGPVVGYVVLVQGGGAVGLCTVQLARRVGTRVIATARSAEDEAVASRAGAYEVFRSAGLVRDAVVASVRALALEGVAHVVEAASDANIAVDTEVLAVGGSIGAYATGESPPPVPFWELLFKNIRLFFLGSDDFLTDAKAAAASDLNVALEAGWSGSETDRIFPLSAIADAYESVESRKIRGRVVVTP